MIKNMFILIIICLFIINSSAIEFPFSTNRMYSYVGRFNVDIQSSNQALSTKKWTTTYPNFTYTYPAHFIQERTHSNIYFGDFQFNNIGNGISCMLQLITKVNGGYIFKVSTNNSQNILKLAVNYIFYYSYNVHSTLFHIKGNIISVKKNISKDPTTFYFTSAPLPANFSLQNVVVKTFFSGFEIKPTNKSNNLDILITSIVNNNMGYKIVISSNSTIPTYVEYLRVLFVIFDSKAMQMNDENGGNKYRIFSGTAQSKIISKLLEFRVKQESSPINFNTIIGLSGFSTINQSIFGFWSEVNEKSFKISVNSIKQLLYFSINYVIIQSQYCSYKTPYLDITTNICYQQCPLATASQLYLMCLCSNDGFLTQDGPKCHDNTRRRRLIDQEIWENQLNDQILLQDS